MTTYLSRRAALRHGRCDDGTTPMERSVMLDNAPTGPDRLAGQGRMRWH